ncbi:MAG: NAD(P)-dependent oxidoreductase [Flavobacteriales bacterium]|nr:NAD(P)-dependent oxidoreductase [Flavobacteriales bacterium]
MKILFIDTTDQYLWDTLTDEGHECTLDDERPKEQVQKDLHLYDGFIIRSRFKIDREFLDAGVNLKFIARVGAGLENIDCQYAQTKGIKLIAAPEGNREAVGEHAVGMLLTLMRRILIADHEVRTGKWIREGNRGYEIQGTTVGIIGYGNMGGAFARCISGFRPKEVLAYDIKEGDYSDEYARKASLEELWEKADIVSLHVPLTPLTRGMINADFFSEFKKPIYFINTARGACCDTQALVRAMENGEVIGAALDVLEYEKSSFENFFAGELPEAFRYLQNSNRVVLTPHIGGWTHQANRKMAQAIISKIKML